MFTKGNMRSSAMLIEYDFSIESFSLFPVQSCPYMGTVLLQINLSFSLKELTGLPPTPTLYSQFMTKSTFGMVRMWCTTITCVQSFWKFSVTYNFLQNSPAKHFLLPKLKSSRWFDYFACCWIWLLVVLCNLIKYLHLNVINLIFSTRPRFVVQREISIRKLWNLLLTSSVFQGTNLRCFCVCSAFFI